MNFVFLGPPGAGKGTAAQKLSVVKSIPHVSTGDLFRAAIAARTDAGEQIRAIVNRGCGSALIQRDDDRVEPIEKWLAVFRFQTLPVVRYDEERALLSRVDSSGGPHETYAQVTEQLRDFR